MREKYILFKLFNKCTFYLIYICIIFVFFLFLNRLAQAEVFLKGNYVEVGIHNSGSFGTAGGQPSGFHGNIKGCLGFVADYGKDGWDVGTPEFSGDFFLPGSREEGWMVEWTSLSGAERSFLNFGCMGEFDIPMASLNNTSSGSTNSGVWEGIAVSGNQKLRIIQTVNFGDEDLFLVINVVMTNVGIETLCSLEYMRNVDPDQEQPWTNIFTTRNWVDSQPPRPAFGSRRALAAKPAGNTNKALTIAGGLTYGLTLGLGTIDTRAVVAAGQGFSNRDTDTILNNPIQGPNTTDKAIVLAYELGDLAPGQSVTIDYAYILNRADLDVAIGSLAAVTILQPSGTISGSNVIFQAKTDDVPNTEQIQFFVKGALVGTDTNPDAGGVFETNFDSRSLSNGTVSIKAIATFVGDKTVEKISTVTVDNSGPPIAFYTPILGQRFSGNSIPIEISILDLSHMPVRVSFFRETATTGSIFLGEDTEFPFNSSFSVENLPEDETVVIKAVGTDGFNHSTTIQVSGTTSVNMPPIADAGGPYFGELAESGGAIVCFNGSGSSDPDNDPLDYRWEWNLGIYTGISACKFFFIWGNST